MVRTKERLAEANKKNSKGKKGGGGGSSGTLSGDALKTALKGEVSVRVHTYSGVEIYTDACTYYREILQAFLLSEE